MAEQMPVLLLIGQAAAELAAMISAGAAVADPPPLQMRQFHRVTVQMHPITWPGYVCGGPHWQGIISRYLQCHSTQSLALNVQWRCRSGIGVSPVGPGTTNPATS
jgi:hypothetical protein